GAPTSPVLSNLICSKMDSELVRLATMHRCKYTRYADDLTFSTSRTSMPLASIQRSVEGQLYCEIVEVLRKTIEANGFKINQKKVRLRDRATRQEVTGLIVNTR